MAGRKNSPAIVAPQDHNSRSLPAGKKDNKRQAPKNPDDVKDSQSDPPSDCLTDDQQPDPCDQKEFDKNSREDPLTDIRRKEEFDEYNTQDRNSKHRSVSQRDEDNTQSGQSIPSEPDDTASQQDSVSTSGEKKKVVCSCLLMSTFIGGSVFGGLLVIGFSLINPWSKPPDSVYNIVPPWGMCPVIRQPVLPAQIDSNFSAESQIKEEIDKRETILKAHLEAKLLDFMVKFTKDMNTSAEEAIENRIREIKKDLNASTENRIKNVSETLSVHLNESTENRFQEVFQEQSKMSEQMKRVEDDFQGHKQDTKEAVAEGEQRCNASLTNTSSEINRILDRLYNDTLKKFEDAEEKRNLVYLVIEHMNFMRANSWGLFVILLGAMEAALYFYICVFLNNRRPRSTDASPSAPVAPPTQVDRGDNNTLCFLYFIGRDLDHLRRWTDGIIKETRVVQRISIMDYVIASRNSIQNIPTCRLALVFVNPDERQLILEDKYHMGSTRRDTVQALRDKGAEVILIVYGDPTSRIRVLQDGLLLDPSLTQVTSHPVLRELNSRRRILSVKESFSEYQKRHLVDTIDQIFT